MKVIVEIQMVTIVEVEVDDKYKALARDDNDMTWEDADNLLDLAHVKAKSQLPKGTQFEVKTVKTLQGKCLAEAW